MKYFLPSLLLLILLKFTGYAQIPCEWAYIPIGSGAYSSQSLITKDSNGDIIQAGKILGIADMDPGTGASDTSYSFPGYNYFLSKTGNDGHLIWIKYFSQQVSLTSFEFIDVETNSNDEIILVGNFFGLVDFDLSSGVDTLRSHFPTYNDYYVAKYNSSGDLIFAFNIGNNTTNNMEVDALTIGTNDDILVCGSPSGGTPVDVDPGPGVHNSISGNGNVVCYDKNGSYLWNNNINSIYSYSVPVKSLDMDADGNSYVCTVGSYQLSVNKFSANGTRLWERTIGNFSLGARVNPQSLLVDKSTGEFYVAGTFQGTVDFDPGVATLSKISTSGFYQDGFIAKYDSSMNPLWVNALAGEMNFGSSSLDFFGNNIVTVGNLTSLIDFGNGISLSPVTTITCPFLCTFDPNGNALNGYVINGPGSYAAIRSSSNQSYFTTGYLTAPSAIDVDPTSSVVNITPGNSRHFVAVYGNLPSYLSEEKKQQQFSVFPNPAHDKIHIASERPILSINYLLTNSTGNILSQGVLNSGKADLSIDDLPAGVYHLKIGEDALNFFRIVKY